MLNISWIEPWPDAYHTILCTSLQGICYSMQNTPCCYTLLKAEQLYHRLSVSLPPILILTVLCSVYKLFVLVSKFLFTREVIQIASWLWFTLFQLRWKCMSIAAKGKWSWKILTT